MLRFTFSLALTCVLALYSAWSMAEYDWVIKSGRVMDPATGLDEIRDIGITDGKITAVSARPLDGENIVNARGLIVAPGFIDLHAHGQDERSNEFQVLDGVTTVFEAEIGVFPVDTWLLSRVGKSRPNYGATSSHLAVRAHLITGQEIGNPIYLDNRIPQTPENDYANKVLSASERNKLLDLIAAGIEQGGVGIGIGSTYTPGADHAEILSLFKLAKSQGVPIFVHIRQARQLGGDLLAPLQEVIANAAATGASLHIVHINSSLGKDVRIAMDMVRGARRSGLDITTESYPYTAGSTRIESAIFDDYQGDLAQLQWTLTGERLNQETFEEYRKQGGWVILHGRDEVTNTWVVAQPDIMVASDGVPFIGNASHPRGAGTFARVLGHYARDLGALDLMTALAKMTIQPANRLATHVPAMARKGRVQVGADADLTIFSADRILDQATYTLPARPSSGISHVMVNGQWVVKDAGLVENAYPGQMIQSKTLGSP
ncbi:MAG: cytosine/adenosine deaminase-related metal-dependent hydrolase [Candidatus Azotimanducaceae bacterium]|jgi:cytosine/adenosine deaminase-related metal-dependent hydrolase